MTTGAITYEMRFMALFRARVEVTDLLLLLLLLLLLFQIEALAVLGDLYPTRGRRVGLCLLSMRPLRFNDLTFSLILSIFVDLPHFRVLSLFSEYYRASVWRI